MLSLDEGISAPFVSVGRENCDANEEYGCCSCCFSSVKEARYSVSWSSEFIAREVNCVVLLTTMLSSRSLISIPSMGLFSSARDVSNISARIGM